MQILFLRSLTISCFLFLSFTFTFSQTIQLYQTVRGSGIVQELDRVTGNVLATNVGGITGGRGMAFSPLGGLYIARNFEVIRLNTAATMASTVVSIPGEIAHDVNFDAVGNLYVVTNLNVRVYDIGLTPTLTFAHNMTTTTGDGNGNKGFGIAVNPTNGQIYVVAAQGLRRFDPVTGLQVGATIAGSSNGMAGIAFTNSAFNAVQFYVGNVISGVDQIRAFDASNTLLRSFFPTHNGNPIDLEVNPANNDLFLFNTVSSNPANRYTSNEVQVATFSTANRPSQGSAIGDFNGIVLQENQIQLHGEAIDGRVQLQWTTGNAASGSEFKVQRFAQGGWQTIATSQLTSAWDPAPMAGKNMYRITARDEQGNQRHSPTIQVLVADPQSCQVWQDASREALYVELSSGMTALRLQLMDLAGKMILEKTHTGSQAVVETSQLPRGVYVLRVQAIEGTAEMGVWTRKVFLR